MAKRAGREARATPRWDPSARTDIPKEELRRLVAQATTTRRPEVPRVRRADLPADLFLHGVRHGWWDPDGRLPPAWSDTYRTARAAMDREPEPPPPGVRDRPRAGPRRRVLRWWRRHGDRRAAARRGRIGP